MLSGMLNNMESRGPDSAGFAIYTKENKNTFKYSICLNEIKENDFKKKISKFIKKIKQVTLKQVNDVIREYLSLDKMESVIGRALGISRNSFCNGCFGGGYQKELLDW